MFRRPRQRQLAEVQLLRAKVDALESALSASAATARLEQMLLNGLQRIASDNAARDSVVEHLWHKVIDREHDLAAAIEHLLDVSTSLTERLEVQDREQRETLDLLRLSLPNDLRRENTPKVIGGSVFATDTNAADVIDIDEADHDTPRRGNGWHTAS